MSRNALVIWQVTTNVLFSKSRGEIETRIFTNHNISHRNCQAAQETTGFKKKRQAKFNNEGVDKVTRLINIRETIAISQIRAASRGNNGKQSKIACRKSTKIKRWHRDFFRWKRKLSINFVIDFVMYTKLFPSNQAVLCRCGAAAAFYLADNLWQKYYLLLCQHMWSSARIHAFQAYVIKFCFLLFYF